jgi:iron(III) transport system permease protein
VNHRVGSRLGGLGIGAIGLLFAAPLVYLVVRSLGEAGRLGEFLVAETTLVPLARTVALAAAVGATTAVLGTSVAWATVRCDVPGRRLLRGLAVVPIVLPSFVGATALLAGFTRGGLVADVLAPLGVDGLPRVSGFWGAWFVLSLFTYPLVLLPVAARLVGLPASLEESGRLLGGSSWVVARTIVWPQVRSSVAAGALLVVLYTISDFGVVSLMRYGTLTQQIYLSKLDPTAWLPLSLVLAALALAVTAGERLTSRRDARRPLVRGPVASVVTLGRWRWPVAGALVLLVAVAVVGPLAVLLFWVIRGATSGSGSVALRLDPTDLLGPAISTVTTSTAAAVLAVALVLPVARSLARRSHRVAPAASVLVVAGYALPGLVVALALVFWSLSSDLGAVLYQTIPLLVLAYAIHFGAQAMRGAAVATESVPDRLADAARSLGARPWRRFRSVELPLLLPGLLAGAGLVVVSAMKELPATLLLAPAGFSTLATSIWSAYEFGSYAQMGLDALALAAVSGVMTWLVVLRRAESS